MPNVSVIIPVYKVEKYIEKCARSLFEQTLEDIEYIFVDDCSPDNSILILNSVISQYPNRIEQIKIIHHESNQGLTRARLSGLEVASGEFIAHCDSDDWVHVAMYEKLYLKACDTNSDVVLCNMNMVEKYSTIEFNTAEIGCDNIETLNNYIVLPWTCAVNMIVCRELYNKYKIYPPVNITYCEDYHLTVRLLYHANKITKIAEPLYCYNRLNTSSITHDLNERRRQDRYWCDLDIIKFFSDHDVLSLYERSLSLRILNYTKYWVLDKKLWKKFMNYYPSSHFYIKEIKDIHCWHKLLMQCLAKGFICAANVIYQIWAMKQKLIKLID